MNGASHYRPSSPLDGLIDIAQDVFIKKCRPFLKEQYHIGLCTGLASLWAYSKLQNREAYFFAQYHAFLAWDGISEPTYNMKDFLNSIKFLQDPEAHFLMQADLATAIRGIRKPDEVYLREDLKLAFNFTKEELISLFKKLPLENHIIMLHTANHAVAAFKQNGKYYFYDPNNGAECWRRSEENFVECIFKSLSPCLDNPAGKYLPLGILLFSNLSSEAVVFPKASDMIGPLLEADPNLVRDDAKPELSSLFMAAKFGDVGVAQALIKRGVDPQAKYKGRCCAEYAAAHNQIAFIKALPTTQEDLNRALLAVACKDWPESLQALLAMGADIHYKNERGLTALDIASSYVNTESMRVLLKAGAWSDNAYDCAGTCTDVGRDGAIYQLDKYAVYRSALAVRAAQDAASDAPQGPNLIKA